MSWKAKIEGFLGGLRKADQVLAKALNQPPRNTGTLDTEHFIGKVRVKRWDVQGFPGITINGSYPGNLHVLMLPGGSYVLEAVKGHRRIAERFAVLNHLRVSLFQYPLSPEHTAVQVRAVLKKAYEKLVREYPEDTFCFFGDSSGGSLALALLREIKEAGGLPMPKGTAVLSPWLDISLTNPKIRLVRRRDRFLPVEELVKAGERYRDGLDEEDPFVSPLYGDPKGLGSILLFAGTEEILAPDCELFTEKAENAEGTQVIFREADGLFHDWILTPLSETEVTLDMIAEFFLETAETGKPKEIRELKGIREGAGDKRVKVMEGEGGIEREGGNAGAGGVEGNEGVKVVLGNEEVKGEAGKKIKEVLREAGGEVENEGVKAASADERARGEAGNKEMKEEI